MINVLGSMAIVYLAGNGLVTNTNIVSRGLIRALRCAADGDYCEAGVKGIAALSAPALMSYATSCALVMDVADYAYQMLGQALHQAELRKRPRKKTS